MISVVVPVYQVEKYIDKCVDSILSQSYRDFELILVDDGSPDRCPELCDCYAAQDSRVRVIRKKNGGLSDARNVGIEQSRGQYITFVDSDDMLLPGALETLLTLCETYQAEMACCGFVRCGDDAALEQIHIPQATVEETCYAEDRMRSFCAEEGMGVQAWAKLYDRSLFQTVRYPVGKYHEDVFTTYKLIHLARKVAVSNRTVYAYRQNPDSITMTFSPKRLDAIRGYLEEAKFMEEYYPELAQYAYSEVIWACNNCLTLMAKADYRDSATGKWMQGLFRKYGRYYNRYRRAYKKKLFVIIAEINMKAAMTLAKIVS